MMKNTPIKQKLAKPKLKVGIALAICFSLFGTAQAQEVVLASGSDASGSGGSASYSVGQTLQATLMGTNDFAYQGIQFYFESETLSIVDTANNLNVSTYPNPSSSTLNLRVSGIEKGKLFYKLFNLLGVLMTSGEVTGNITKIDIDHLPMATYLLAINNYNNTIKTFKIIKN
ncbi:T9SS type A sorting domain-containing protein [Snuella sedimenti]|uniref:T9SS type A sorting domain-containing protein n=1 Tax=Snuella sedimenti TaxID=2798802 RepID=A0A8J7LSY6_9FLAO|nr:T9SS type A sorting domain-containing protein [Snuella sedimenti]MBJ6367686.1 T9SS type A sorting domain-containing protein [Snuella sedimenti]